VRNEGFALFVILAILILFLIGFPILEDLAVPEGIE